MQELLDFLVNNIGMVSSGVFALLTMLFGGKFAIIKKKFSQLIELLSEIEKAVEDEKLTKEELQEIIKDAKALIGK